MNIEKDILRHFKNALANSIDELIIKEYFIIIEKILKKRVSDFHGEFHQSFSENLDHINKDLKLKNRSHFYFLNYSKLKRLSFYRNELTHESPEQCKNYIPIEDVNELIFYHIKEYFKEIKQIEYPKELTYYNFDALSKLYDFLNGSSFYPNSKINLKQDKKYYEDRGISKLTQEKSTQLVRNLGLEKIEASNEIPEIMPTETVKSELEIKKDIEFEKHWEAKIWLERNVDVEIEKVKTIFYKDLNYMGANGAVERLLSLSKDEKITDLKVKLERFYYTFRNLRNDLDKYNWYIERFESIFKEFWLDCSPMSMEQKKIYDEKVLRLKELKNFVIELKLKTYSGHEL